MQRSSGKLHRFALTIAVGLAVGAIAPQAAGARPQTAASCHRACDDVRFSILKGFDDPATPDDLDRVGVLEVGPERARNVLVLSPGTSAGAGYFKPLADDIVRRAHGRWQVWSVERRENLLEDQSVLDLAKQGKATPQQLFDYYLGWLTNPSITNHFQPVPDSMVPFARGWGMNVEIQDLHRVVQAAGELDRRGHRSERPLARADVPVAAGQPEATGAGDQRSAVRLRGGHRDLAPLAHRRAGARRASRRQRRPARVGPGR